MRVLTTWLRWGVLYRFPMGINSFHLPPFCGRFFKYFLVGFSSGTSRIAGFGEGTPQQDLPKGQNRRYADFGTVVESCSKKLPDCAHFLLPLFREIYNQLFHKRLRAGVLPLLPTNHKRAEWTDFPARTFPAAQSFPTIRRFGSCVLPVA